MSPSGVQITDSNQFHYRHSVFYTQIEPGREHPHQDCNRTYSLNNRTLTPHTNNTDTPIYVVESRSVLFTCSFEEGSEDWMKIEHDNETRRRKQHQFDRLEVQKSCNYSYRLTFLVQKDHNFLVVCILERNWSVPQQVMICIPFRSRFISYNNKKKHMVPTWGLWPFTVTSLSHLYPTRIRFYEIMLLDQLTTGRKNEWRDERWNIHCQPRLKIRILSHLTRVSSLFHILTPNVWKL